MPKLAKEIMLGFIPVLLVFLVFVGVNIVPLLIAAALVGGLLFIAKMKGGIAVGAANERKRKRADLPS